MSVQNSKMEIKTSIKIALVDDHNLFREGIKIALRSRQDIEVIWEADNGNVVHDKMEEEMPDLVVLDLKMPGSDGATVLQMLKQEYSKVKVVILSTDEDPETVSNIMEIGANAYLTKTANASEIILAIETCIKDEYYFNDLVNNAVMSRLLQRKNVSHGNNQGRKLVQFTDREIAILQLLADDKTTEEISKTVFLSVRSIETIRQNMKIKVNAKTIGGLIMYGVRNKLVV